MSATYATINRTFLDDRIANGPAHFRPVMMAVRDAGCSFAVVQQGRERFDLPTSHPTIAVIGDDMRDARGPAGFHRKSLRRYLKRCRGIVIVSCEPMVTAYASAAATAAAFKADVALIETRIEQELNWYNFVREHAPAAAVLIATVQPAGGLH